MQNNNTRYKKKRNLNNNNVDSEVKKGRKKPAWFIEEEVMIGKEVAAVLKSVVLCQKSDETFSKCFGTKTIYHQLTLAYTRTHSLSFFIFLIVIFIIIYLCFYYMMRVIDLGRKFFLFALAPTYCCLVPRKLESTVERLVVINFIVLRENIFETYKKYIYVGSIAVKTGYTIRLGSALTSFEFYQDGL